MEKVDYPINEKQQQLALFMIGCIIFLIASMTGWVKLRYGFNFIDEGYHMTESWRLAAGDDFFKDKFTGALRTFVFINALIFKAFPDITLLDFRELQYVLTMASLFVMSFALFRISRQFWFQPLVFSLFAFTGLDPVGMISNLSYYTYPHLFITLHLACFIIGISTSARSVRMILFILSGCFLWLISFSLPHLSPIAISPVVLFLLFKRLKIESLDFSIRDLCSVLAPFLFFWAFFVGIFNKLYIQNFLSSAKFMLSTPTHGSLLTINWAAMIHTIIVMLFLLAVFFCTKLPKLISTSVLSIMAIIMYFIIDTSLLGLISRYYNGWLGRPMWFAALVLASLLGLFCYLLIRIFLKNPLEKIELYALITIIPCILLSFLNSIFSALGILTVLYTSIPAIAALACMTLSIGTTRRSSSIQIFIVLLFLLMPFYVTTAQADWEFSYFDVPPKQATKVIDHGFARGIKTNEDFYRLYVWIAQTSERYSQTNDFILSYVVTPMVNMIAMRRPSLDDPYISMTESPSYYFVEAIDFMKSRDRTPRLAYIFEAMPCLVPYQDHVWFGRQFHFPSIDPISEYISENMILVDDFKISNGLIVRCFIDKSYAEKTGLEPKKVN